VHQVGLKGESLQLWEHVDAVTWNTHVDDGINRPITWWYATFPTPAGNSNAVVLDLSGLGKGYVYVNGNGIGRYWNVTAPGNCPPCSEIQCDYRGYYKADKCPCDCGLPTERYYHVPRDWLVPIGGGQNKLVLFEEMGASDVSKVDIVVMDQPT